MTVKEAAEARGCSVQRILQLIHKRDAKGKPSKRRLIARKFKGDWIINLKDLQAIQPTEED